jgi:hypothetical protein
MNTECETCGGSGRIAHGEFGGDCAAIHGMGGHMPEAPSWERCDDCEGIGHVKDEETDDEC